MKNILTVSGVLLIGVLNYFVTDKVTDEFIVTTLSGVSILVLIIIFYFAVNASNCDLIIILLVVIAAVVAMTAYRIFPNYFWAVVSALIVDGILFYFLKDKEMLLP